MRARLLVAWSVAALTAALTTAVLAGPAAGTTKHRPAVTSMSLRSAPTTGGQRVVVHGRNMSQHLRVTVLGRVVGYRRLSDHTITVRVPSRSTPAHGWLRMHTAAGGTSSTGRASSFAYHWPAPVLTSVSPKVVSTNLPMVTVQGRYLYDVRSVTEGGVHPYYFSQSNDGRSITFPSIVSAAGRIPLRVSAAQGVATMSLTIAPPPSVDRFNPADGLTTGGVTVTITGNALDHPTRVTFGGVPATHVVGVDSHTVTAVTPAHAAGQAQVVVTNAVDSSAPSRYDAYRYGPSRPQTFGAATTVDSTGWIDQLACPDPGLCMAIDNHDRYLTSDGHSWSPVSPDGATGSAGYQTLSCTSATFCLSATENLVWRWNGLSWTSVEPPVDDRVVTILAVQCTSTTFCVAISRSKAWVYNGGSFASAALPFGVLRGLANVSCWAAGQCEVAATDGGLATLSDGVWRTDGGVVDIGNDQVLSLYCSSHIDCLAGTARGSIVSSRTQILHVLPLPISRLLCTSTSSCLVATGNAAATSVGGVWSAVQYYPGDITAVTRTGESSALVGSMHDVRTMTW
ncbi:IPT/TIG domain-containing protein [uncultured Jatrophihabitans sp.]|uniref:IPT/TIG domain-containing protein n=1 Tax=uncultured Jatrophihabitans sp. TaxID=1610747 RepID=UPI0035CB0527